MTRIARRAPGHPQWCAGGHRCALGEHRSEPVTLATASARVSAVVTLVRPASSTQMVVEVRLSLRTPAGRDDRAGATHALSALAVLVDALAEELTR